MIRTGNLKIVKGNDMIWSWSNDDCNRTGPMIALVDNPLFIWFSILSGYLICWEERKID